ncbi:MAG: enoyl-CoA hydratase-related protein [Steroidobacteraceae bacterium]
MTTAEHSNPPVTSAVQTDGVAIVTIDRPKRLNALNLEVKNLISSAIEALVANDAVRVIVLTGAGGVFVAGTDIAEMRDLSPADHTRLGTDLVFHSLRNCPKPLIAAVERFALGGGCELALACDIIVAAEDAKFGQPEIKVGIMPGAGGTQILLRTLGKYQAMKLILTGEQIPASLALSWGLISETTAPGQALVRALELGKTIAGMPPLAVRAIKETIRSGQDMPLTPALQLERKTFQMLFDTKDQVEGMQAFLDKRPPVFRGE